MIWRGLEKGAVRKSGDKNGKPILVTGSHRSGSTWAGRILAMAPHTAYIHEPFNVYGPAKHPAIPFTCWFQYICDDNGAQYKRILDDILHYRYPLRLAITKAHGVRGVARVGRDQWRSRWHRLRQDRPIVKDPIAFFSAPWLAKTFDMDVLVMIRHPAAFCSSLKAKEWRFDFNHFLSQPLLMRDQLGVFEKEIRAYASQERDIIDQGILLWKCIHQTVARYQEEYPEWIFARHEALSANPGEGFRDIYQALGLEFTPTVESGIIALCGTHNPAEERSGDALKRNSRENIRNWERRLTREEIDRIRQKTAEVAGMFYTDEDW